ncbi:OLC1v1000044C1 [Oldenlandia corymbosa var. corymbosa]|uniref:RNA polymerase II C-terminal domain phosphatase-like n=1 Tax=Oldenlandia corymbosa var. corymbosa TaxID=529605 RepID=A0AAV1D1Y9_OLDCO|nr:OLC1v1000044C1 [Oldenlandia corymbosa var. corymbosa]
MMGKRVRLENSSSASNCTHPGLIGGLCIKCGETMDNDDGFGGVALEYIHKRLRLSLEEIIRLRDKDFRNQLRQRKLYLVLDLDNTLLHSMDVNKIQENQEQFFLNRGIYKVERVRKMTKLRPFVHTFLEEASKLFDMYVYTMGCRNYAVEMAKLLDPEGVYFNSKIIAHENSTDKSKKGLDVVLGKENAVLILDDRESVWEGHRDNLILVEKYEFFGSGVTAGGTDDENDGVLDLVLKVLQRIHASFYDTEDLDTLLNRDVRRVLQDFRKEALKGCKIVFSGVLKPEKQHYWKLAEKLGAKCATKRGPGITHVVSLDSASDLSCWAIREKRFLVNPEWIDAARYLWQRQPEEKFPVTNELKIAPVTSCSVEVC